MCRKDIPEINNFLKYINNLKTQIEDLEDRLEELWAQIN
jgi:ubiquinone biosynthesis protein UbiJ